MVKDAHHHNNSHVPVLLEAALKYLAPKKGEKYLDLTAGYGGHASKFLAICGFEDSVLVDRDEKAINSLAFFKESGTQVIHNDFVSAANDLIKQGKKFDIVLADLGVSSPHLDNTERGFSFQAEAKLDMRMDQSQPLSAADVVNTYSLDDLTKIIKQYGEEPRAKQIAQAIVSSRPVETTIQLASIVEKTIGRRGKIHPATRTFQAIRIAVNDELGQVEKLLPLLPNLLKDGGRAGIISFHSLEDRLVKKYFAEQSYGYEAKFKLLTKKPISGSDQDVINPRARSAKLRVAVKIKNFPH